VEHHLDAAQGRRQGGVVAQINLRELDPKGRKIGRRSMHIQGAHAPASGCQEPYAVSTNETGRARDQCARSIAHTGFLADTATA